MGKCEFGEHQRVNNSTFCFKTGCFVGCLNMLLELYIQIVYVVTYLLKQLRWQYNIIKASICLEEMLKGDILMDCY